MLAQVVVLFDQLELDASRLRVAQVERPRSSEVTWAVYCFEPHQLQELSSTPRELHPRELQELRRAWKAYTSSIFTDLADYVAAEGCLPILHRAMKQLVYRYPDLRSGLSIWDERLLRNVEERGPSATRVLGYTIGYNETPDWVGDVYLFRRLVALGDPSLASPLLSIKGSKWRLRECTAELTPFGESVLLGEASHVQTNGIDDWIGGVHLTSGGPIVFRDGDELATSVG